MYDKHHLILNQKEMKLKKVKVAIHNTVDDGIGYAEIGQSQNTKQALLVREGPTKFIRITGFVKCRDFLVDTYSYDAAGKNLPSIWGFSHDNKKAQPDWKSCNIQMHFSDADSRVQFLKHVPEILHVIEKDNKYDLTEIFEIEDSQDLIVVGDLRWLQNCLSFSLWSLLLRVCCYDFDAKKDWIKEFGSKPWTDSKYISSIQRKTFDKVLGDLKSIATKNFCGFDATKVGVHTIHHNSGFISVFGWHTEISPTTAKSNPHWQEMYGRGLNMHPKTVAA